jgi:hypothetical protein
MILCFNSYVFVHFRDVTKLQNVLSEMVSAIVKEFLQPEVNNLIARS